MFILFVVGLLFLFYFSYIDYKYQRLGNTYILGFFIIGLLFHGLLNDRLAVWLGVALMMGIAGTLWYFNTIGGADFKLLVALVPYLPFLAIPNMLSTILFFIIKLALVGVLYGQTAKAMKVKGKYIPFIPVITLTYIIALLTRIY